MDHDVDAAKAIISALARDDAASWEAFVRLASKPAWVAALKAAPRREMADGIFSHLLEQLFADRLSLAARLAASGFGDAMAFLEREIETLLGRWLSTLFAEGAADAGEVLVRLFLGDIESWVARATPPLARASIEDRIQEVFAGLLERQGHRLRAYGGNGPFRAYLRSVVVNLTAEAGRRQDGRVRKDATGATVPRPRLVSLDDDDMAEPAGDMIDPLATLIEIEDLRALEQRRQSVLAAVRALPADARQVLEARFVDGLKPRDIAELLHRDVKEIYRILERSLVQLKSGLGERT